MPNILIVGPSQSGKDTAALMLCEATGLKYAESMSKLIAPLAGERLGMTAEEAYECRHEHRRLWFDLGNELREGDPCALLRMGFAKGSVLTGARCKDEVEVGFAIGLIDFAVWMNRPVAGRDWTLKYTRNDLPSDGRVYEIDNSRDREHLFQEVLAFAMTKGLLKE